MMTYNFVWIMPLRHGNDGMEVRGGVITEREYLPECCAVAPDVTLSGELERQKTLRGIPKKQKNKLIKKKCDILLLTDRYS